MHELLHELPVWVALVTALGISWRLTRGGGGSAVSELSAANQVLEKRNHELGAEVRDLRVENATLKARTDFQEQLRPVLSAMELHEVRAQERHEKALVVLDLIAQRLGGEENNVH